MGWQYRVVDLDGSPEVGGSVESLEEARSELSQWQQSYPWPDRLVIQKRWVGGWEPLEPAPQNWEDATTEGPRKAWDSVDEPPEQDAGWELDYSRGRPGEAWDRFDYTEERYWRRWIGEGERPADEEAPYLAANGLRMTIDQARTNIDPTLWPIVWMPKNTKLR